MHSELEHPDRRLPVSAYLVAITGLITLVLCTGSFIVERQLSARRGYARLINTAGRQRMLSQRLAKTAVELGSASASAPALVGELKETLREWRGADELLARGDFSTLPQEDSQANRASLASLHQILQRISLAADAIVAASGQQRPPPNPEVLSQLQTILREEPEFLSRMDRLVKQFQHEAEEQLARTEQIQKLSTCAALILIVLLCWFGFRPLLLRNENSRNEAIWQREAALESETKLRALLEAIPDAISCYDSNLRYLSVNAVMAQMRGHGIADFEGRTDRELGVRAELCEPWERYLRRAWETRLPQVTNFDFPTPDGVIKCRARAVPRLKADGSVSDLVVVTRDVTKEQEAASNLKIQKHFLERLLFTLPELIYVTDLRSDKMTYANGNLRTLLGYDVDDLNALTDRSAEMIHPEDFPAYQRRQKLIGIAEDGQLLRAEYRCRHADGSWRWLSTWVTVFARAADGTPTQIIGNAQDITDRVATEERFRVLFEYSSEAHILLGADGVLDCNAAAIRMLGCSDKKHLQSMHPATFSPEYQPDGRLSIEKAHEMNTIARQKGHHRFDWVQRRADGADFPVEVSLTLIQLAGKPALLTVMHDLTERNQAAQELSANKRFIEKIAATVPSGIFVYDTVEHRNAFCNEANAAMFGYSLSEFNKIREPSISPLHPDEVEPMRATMQALESLAENETMEVEFRALHRTGQIRWIACRLTVFARNARGEVTQILGVNQDITTRRKTEEALTFRAMNDALTELPNRRAFFERLSAAMEKSLSDELRSTAGSLTICICDIDKFKQVNDTHGHNAGDDVLVAFSQIVREEIRSVDFCARLGGDEFCICLPGTDVDHAGLCIERIRRRMETLAFDLSGNPFSVTVSFGLSQWNFRSDMDGLMEAADKALYAAKKQGRNCTAQIHLLTPVERNALR